MAGRKVIYILLTLIAAYVGLMYDSPVPGFLLGFLILLYLVLFLVSFLLVREVEISADVTSDGVVDTNDNAKIMFTVTNKGHLPISDMLIHIQVRNRLDDEEKEYDMNMRSSAGTVVRAPFVFSSSYCGVVRVTVTEIRVFDYLRLFCRKRKMNFIKECVIMPPLHDMQIALTENSMSDDDDSDEYDKHHSGDDPSEIFQIREYRQGDKMSRVNWKMSARMDTLMVKELSRPISNSVGIYLDLRFNGIEEAQSVFELCYSLSMALLDKECHHRLIWSRKRDSIAFEEVRITNAEDLTEAMAKLLTSGRRQESLNWEAYMQAGHHEHIHRMICITCMDPNQDLEEFQGMDSMKKSILTIADIDTLIEI